MKKNNKGFTLAELLIVVAIIAVLVAIAIPIFTAQLEKSREGVDAANIRSAYAEVMADLVSGKTDTEKVVNLKQETTGWQNAFEFPANLEAGSTEPAKNGTATIKANAAGDGATITIKLTKASD